MFRRESHNFQFTLVRTLFAGLGNQQATKGQIAKAAERGGWRLGLRWTRLLRPKVQNPALVWGHSPTAPHRHALLHSHHHRFDARQ
jgi:hypothetical protein